MANTLMIARDPQTPGKKLMTMLTHSDQAVREALASNPNLPKKGLLKLLGEFPGLVLDNPAMALLMLEDARIFQKAPEELQIEWASSEQTPPWLLAMLCELRRNGVREALASNRATPAESLAGLAFPEQFGPAPQDDDDWCDPQYSVLENPAITDGLRFDLMKRVENDDIDLDFTYVPDLEEPEPYGLDPETEHSWCFSIDEDEELDALPLNRDETGVYYLPACDGVVVGGDATGSENEPDRWGRWDNEDERSLWGLDWQDLSENPATPTHLITRMVRHNDPAVRAGAALRPELSTGELAALALDPALEVRLAVAQNPSTSAEALALLAQSESYCIRCAVASHRSTDRETLKKLANDPWNGVRATALRNTHPSPSAPADGLMAA